MTLAVVRAAVRHHVAVAGGMLITMCLLAAPAGAQPRAAQPLLAPPATVPQPEPPPPAPKVTAESAPAPSPSPAVAPAPAPTGVPEPGSSPSAVPDTMPPPARAPNLDVQPEPVPPPAPSPPPAPPAPPPAPTYAPPPEPRGPCLLGEWCFGPVFTLGAINPLGFGAQVRGDYFGAGIDYQFMPRLTVSDTSARWSLFSLDARVYPFAGSFWVGLGFGYQSFSGEFSRQTEYGRISANGSLGIPMFKLGIGFASRSGLIMGMDLNFGFPLGDTDLDFDVRTDAPSQVQDEPTYQSEVADVRKQVEDLADGAITLLPFIPQLNLFRIGYMF